MDSNIGFILLDIIDDKGCGCDSDSDYLFALELKTKININRTNELLLSLLAN